jgi:hypothetical protein
MPIERGQFIVSGCDTLGNPALVDVLDLEELSFRAYVLDRLAGSGLLKPLDGWQATGEAVPYRAKMQRG